MNTKLIVLLVAVVVLAVVKANTDHYKFHCRSAEAKLGDDVKTAVKECHKELADRLKAKKGDKVKPDACYTACKMEKLKIVQNGKVDPKVTDAAVEKTFPKAVHVEMKAAFKNCSALAPAKLDKKVDCAPYVKVANCKHLAVRRICKNDKLIQV